jgi:negative regulator of sigma E activity
MFIEKVAADDDNRSSGLQKVGSAYAFHSDIQGYEITAVGEVPAVTVKNMVSSLTREPAVAGK